MKKIILAFILIFALSLSVFSCDKDKAENKQAKKDYDKAIALLEEGDYEGAYELFKALGDYEDSETYLKRFHYVPVNVSDKTYSYRITLGDNNLPQKLVIKTSPSHVTYEYSYDERGNLIKEIYTDRLKNVSTSEYAYDTKGDMTSAIYTDSKGNSVYNHFICEYNENGKLTKKTHTEDGKGTTSYEYNYDEKGNLVKTVVTYPDKNQSVYDYKYDDNGNVIRESHNYDYKNKYVVENTYDEKGDLIKYVYTTPSGYTHTKNYTYTYNTNGNLIRIKCERRENGALSADIEETTLQYEFVYIPYDLSAEEVNEIFYKIIGS